jgi:hypothetical protein
MAAHIEALSHRQGNVECTAPEDLWHMASTAANPVPCAVYPIESCRLKPQKFLAFQVDFGGWNNILMQFEIMVVMACITGRTLVLPPATRLYLLGDEPRCCKTSWTWMHFAGTCLC